MHSDRRILFAFTIAALGIGVAIASCGQDERVASPSPTVGVRGTNAADVAAANRDDLKDHDDHDDHDGPHGEATTLYVWASDQAHVAPDFLAVIDFDRHSSHYGSVLSTVPIPPP